ncbi:hypothetical protein K502DRAFT_345437 [Neoconidiobolus thromboides FSU 785]|nr:hypothetical protein K502DRAFT_345437 [Neoconidiobolus thromboides FSU 785]
MGVKSDFEDINTAVFTFDNDIRANPNLTLLKNAEYCGSIEHEKCDGQGSLHSSILCITVTTAHARATAEGDNVVLM